MVPKAATADEAAASRQGQQRDGITEAGSDSTVGGSSGRDRSHIGDVRAPARGLTR